VVKKYLKIGILSSSLATDTLAHALRGEF